MSQQQPDKENKHLYSEVQESTLRLFKYFLGKNFAKKYKLMFSDEKEQKVFFSFRMSLLTATLFFTFLSILTAIFVVIVMTQTPLQSYLPGYLDVEKRKDVVNTSLRLDSLTIQNVTRTAYLDNISKVLQGTMSSDSLLPLDSVIVQYDKQQLLAAAAPSDREKQFVSQFEEREKYGLSVLSNVEHGSDRVFLMPVSGEALPLTETLEQRWTLKKSVPVLAPLSATVIAVDLTMADGYKIVLQHANGYMSLFSNIVMPLVEVGDVVKEGMSIGQAGNAQRPAESWVGVHVWHNGRPVDPTSVFPM